MSTLLSHIEYSVKMAACSACSVRSYAKVSQQAETYFPGIPLLRGNATVKRATKTSTFSTVLQNELKSDVTCLITHVLATNQVVASCVNTDF